MSGRLAGVNSEAMPEQRHQSLEKIRRNGAFDVIVLGGGINGIGVFRELALQGLRVLLVERNDFCSGCSAAPSRMIHGGLRYLENGEFDLVRESLRERDALLANAPHMVKALPTTIPIRTTFSGLLNGATNFLGLSEAPSNRGALAVKAGVLLYDWITRYRRVLPRHVFRGARQTFAQWPGLDPKLRYSATYYDAWISYPERLGIELLLDTARLAPEGVALNYAELSREGTQFVVTCSASGTRLEVTTKALVNATGAWVDESVAQLDSAAPATERLVEGTKGSHLILDCEPLYRALNGHMIFYENEDGRVCIVFPYLGMVLAGSTDIRVSKAERVRCDPDEQDYILNSLRIAFPNVDTNASHVVYSYSGIRPLPKSDHAFTGRISRSHFVHRLKGDVPQFCMIGGKWTTFRAFAEQTTDDVLIELGKPRLTSTNALSIGGGAGFTGDGADTVAALVHGFGIEHSRANHLVEAYGTNAVTVMAFCKGRADDLRLDDKTEITGAEIVYLIRREFVVGLSDLLQRRTSLAIRGQVTAHSVERVAGILASELDWTPARQRDEVHQFIADLENYHGVSHEMLDQRTQDRSNACA
jgi:glycerol-3-phosphate dehydrogenase